MRIRTLLFLFLSIPLLLISAPVPSQMVILSASKSAVYEKVEGTSSPIQVKVDVPATGRFLTSGPYSELHLFLSTSTNIWGFGDGELNLDSIEQDVETEDVFLNIRLAGNFDFKTRNPFSENSCFIIQTNSAELEIKSTYFYVSTYKHITVVECYQGSITITDQKTFKQTTVSSGKQASIYGNDEMKNQNVKITDLTQENYRQLTDRIGDKTIFFKSFSLSRQEKP